jgi:hypothetical protein
MQRISREYSLDEATIQIFFFQTAGCWEAVHAATIVSEYKSGRGGVGEKGLTVVQLSVQSIGGSLDKGVGDSTELRVISVTVDGVGSALLGEEKEFLEQHFV